MTRRVRRLRLDRQALPPPGRDRHALGAHDRPADARRRHDHDPRPRHARARSGSRSRARARCCSTGSSSPGGPGRRLGWHELAIESEALRGNPLGDPARRPLFVWTPPADETGPERRYPAIYLLHAMTGQARSWFNVSPFAASLPEQIDELAPEAVVVARRRLHRPRRRPVDRLAGDRRLRALPLRGRRRLRRRALPDPRRAGAPRARREVLGRVRGRRLVAAAARPLRRLRQRTPATRSSR